MHGERQVERRFVFGLLWPHISPLQMNINKELLISAACTVREYVCMQGRHRGAVWTSLPPPLCFSSVSSSSTQPVSPALLSSSSCSIWLFSFPWLLCFISSSFSSSLTCFIPAVILPVYHDSLCFKGGGCWYWCWHRFCIIIQSRVTFLSAIW